MDAWKVARLALVLDRRGGHAHIELELADEAGDVFAWKLFSLGPADLEGWDLHRLVLSALYY